MAKSKLLAAFDAHRGRDYKLEKQKKLQKQAAKRKKSKVPDTDSHGKEKVEKNTNGSLAMAEAESDGWHSNESEYAEPAPVWRASTARQYP
jgi:rRNA-processing protein EBP2